MRGREERGRQTPRAKGRDILSLVALVALALLILALCALTGVWLFLTGAGIG